ncbi:MAG TPA: pyruvate formate lyase family protein [Spirochaetales bacterium]|nr:pyruvate formate lyase family protein [Spirochaetales bacterium]
MTERIARLRRQSVDTKPNIDIQRALLITEAYASMPDGLPPPIARARSFAYICEHKDIYVGADDLIVGERGRGPKRTSTYPELTCHSVEDLKTLRSRPMTSYDIDDDSIEAYRERVIPYWRGRCIRDRAFADLPAEWLTLYEAGVFTEFMEQRAAGHTALDGLLYRKGLREIKADVAAARSSLPPEDPRLEEKSAELEAMAMACDAMIRLAERHAEKAEELSSAETDPARSAELRDIAAVCRRVPAEAPRTFHEALQAYWFVHIGTLTELNGWDAMSPGHLDQHLEPFYRRDLAEGRLTRERAKELLSSFWIKVNNTPAPPKVGVTAAESGTYNDFTNINLGGLSPDGRDGSGEVTLLALEVLEELRLLQPQANLQVSAKTPDRVLEAACSVVREGMGYPSLFNADEVTLAQVASGKSLRDAREGGTSGCIETGCFGKEAYILHGYLNGPKLLELALNDGVDPATGRRVGPATGPAESFGSVDELFAAWVAQMRYAVDWKARVDGFLDDLYGRNTPAPFLSLYIADCVARGLDYYRGGARYNSDYIQCVGLGTVTDSLSAIGTQVFKAGKATMAELVEALKADWAGRETLRALARNRSPLFGNDDDEADALAARVFDAFVDAVERDGGKPRISKRGAPYRANFLSTTCHVYFGTKTGATPDGRKAGEPLSDGTSPSHGADRLGPTAVMNSLGKLDQAKTGGTLLNLRFSPSALAGADGPKRLARLVRGYFRQGGHHVQFNVVDEATLRAAKRSPSDYRSLLVRVAGYSDYFVDLDELHQDEIISRTAHERA